MPAIAFAAGLERPTVDDWQRVNLQVPRLVDALPNGPVGHPTVRVFLAGGVPEVMLHLRDLGLLDLDVLTVAGVSLRQSLEWWEKSDRRQALRRALHGGRRRRPRRRHHVASRSAESRTDEHRLFSARQSSSAGIGGQKHRHQPQGAGPRGRLSQDRSGAGVHARSGCNRCNQGARPAPIKPGDVLVLAGRGPLGSGMEEIYQITAALKHLSWGHEVAVVTDARFSGVSTGACIGHVGPEALAGGPLGKLRDGDTIQIVVDCQNLAGSVDFVGTGNERLDPAAGAEVLAGCAADPSLTPDPALPDDTRLWAALQAASGGTWGGCVYDVDKIVSARAAHS